MKTEFFILGIYIAYLQGDVKGLTICYIYLFIFCLVYLSGLTVLVNIKIIEMVNRRWVWIPMRRFSFSNERVCVN